jgi:hypothetical protein
VQSSYTVQFTGSTLQAGASIKSVTVETGNELQIFSGSGSPSGATAAGQGSAGGNIENITISSAFTSDPSDPNAPSYRLDAGDGANGTGGGAGGSIINVTETSSNGSVYLTGGDGGAGTTGAGGDGGGVRGLDLQSDGANYTVTGGKGGNGASGGAGGSLVNNNFAGKTPSTGIIITGDFTGDSEDDVLVVDLSSGGMVLSKNDGTGFDFEQVAQYADGVSTTFIIEGAGTTPVDATAGDFNADGLLDIIVAYKNSNSIAIYYNQGDGVFWSTADQAFAVSTLDLGFSPSEIVVGQYTGSANLDIAVLETTTSESTLHIVKGTAAADPADKPTLELLGNSVTLSGIVTDLIAGPSDGSTLYAGFETGEINLLEATFATGSIPFEESTTGGTLAGEIANLDLSADGKQLLALGVGGKLITLFDLQTDGSLTQTTAPTLDKKSGSALVARFLPNDGTDLNSIAVLSSQTAGGVIEIFQPVISTEPAEPADPALPPKPPTFEIAKTILSTLSLKNFAPAVSSDGYGLAALGGSLSKFVFSQDGNAFKQFELPFAGKRSSLFAGDGGNALGKGKGGAGGSISGLNVEASQIFAEAGDAGNSMSGAAGAGGSISNPASFKTAGGATVAPKITAELLLQLQAGNGGTAAASGRKAAGGAGGSVTSMTVSLTEGDIEVTAGNGGGGNGAAGGSGGNIASLTSTAFNGGLIATAGSGGNAAAGKVLGGKGGAISKLTHTQSLEEMVEELELGYAITLTTGNGGSSVGGNGGAGGALDTANLVLDLSNSGDKSLDSTTVLTASTGAGGTGTNGGAGGSISGLTANAGFDQISEKGGIPLNYFTADLSTGSGGAGTAGAGGIGGSVSQVVLSGVSVSDNDLFSDYDPSVAPLSVVTGNGGNGTTKGGAGGAIASIVAQNSIVSENSVLTATLLHGASFITGNGGDGGSSDGGKGGEISGVVAGTTLGSLILASGNGGTGGGKGGAGGAILKSTLGSTAPISSLGLLVVSGDGGGGVAAGGAGGLVSELKVNTSQLNFGTAAVLLAGDGGGASGAGAIGGKGGDITRISQGKDLNSAINVIEAGNGGASGAGKGGNGGNVFTINTLGFIGKPNDGTDYLGAFDEFGLPQGVFSGRGGIGSAGNGTAGSVTSITARQIAAIAAAADGNGLFGVASLVSKISADLIGYDVDRDGVFDSTGAGSPSQDRPIDGFVLAAIAQVNNAFKVFNA